jgi:hypothetical protein
MSSNSTADRRFSIGELISAPIAQVQVQNRDRAAAASADVRTSASR